MGTTTSQHHSGNTKQNEPYGNTTFMTSGGNEEPHCPLGNSEEFRSKNSEFSSSGKSKWPPSSDSSVSTPVRTATVALVTDETSPVARHVYTQPSVEALLHLVKCAAASDEEIFVMAYALRQRARIICPAPRSIKPA